MLGDTTRDRAPTRASAMHLTVHSSSPRFLSLSIRISCETQSQKHCKNQGRQYPLLSHLPPRQQFLHWRHQGFLSLSSSLDPKNPQSATFHQNVYEKEKEMSDIPEIGNSQSGRNGFFQVGFILFSFIYVKANFLHYLWCKLAMDNYPEKNIPEAFCLSLLTIGKACEEPWPRHQWFYVWSLDKLIPSMAIIITVTIIFSYYNKSFSTGNILLDQFSCIWLIALFSVLCPV